MKKFFFAAILFPLFAGAQTSWTTQAEPAYSSDNAAIEQTMTPFETEIAMTGRTAQCGRHSDSACSSRRVFDSCERDASHGIYGQCRDIGERSGEVICSCR